jgi:hypothetical protein
LPPDFGWSRERLAGVPVVLEHHGSMSWAKLRGQPLRRQGSQTNSRRSFASPRRVLLVVAPRDSPRPGCRRWLKSRHSPLRRRRAARPNALLLSPAWSTVSGRAASVAMREEEHSAGCGLLSRLPRDSGPPTPGARPRRASGHVPPRAGSATSCGAPRALRQGTRSKRSRGARRHAAAPGARRSARSGSGTAGKRQDVCAGTHFRFGGRVRWGASDDESEQTWALRSAANGYHGSTGPANRRAGSRPFPVSKFYLMRRSPPRRWLVRVPRRGAA